MAAKSQAADSAGERLVNSRGYTGTMRNLYLSSASCFLGVLSFGYMIGFSSPALPEMQKQGVLSDNQASWFGSLATFGGMVGCIVGGLAVEKLGRKTTLMSTSLPFLTGCAIMWYFSDASKLYLGRWLTGLGSGMVTVCAPMYIAETSTKELRGMLGSGVQLSITLGILLVYVLGMYLSWRSLAFVGIVLPMVAAAFTARIPETPRFHLLKNNKKDALVSLQWLRGPHADVEEELRDIEESLDPEEKMSMSELWKPQLLRPLKVAVGLMVFQQLSGINVVMFYTVSIFESAGFKETGTFATVIIGAVQVVCTFIACLLMDKAGRRVLLLLGGMGMALSCFTLGYYFYIMNTPGADMSWLALSSLIVYIIAFSLGWGPIPMLIMSEIFPVRARGTASAITAISNWICAFIITLEFSTLQNMLGQYGAFWLFGSCMIFALLFVWKLVPETKGKSLEDIELYFLGRAIRGI